MTEDEKKTLAQRLMDGSMEAIREEIEKTPAEEVKEAILELLRTPIEQSEEKHDRDVNLVKTFKKLGGEEEKVE